MARAFDFWGGLAVDRPMLSDAEALRSDWEVVGRDLEIAIEQVMKEHG
jgi:hypothetical protein